MDTLLITVALCSFVVGALIGAALALVAYDTLVNWPE